MNKNNVAVSWYKQFWPWFLIFLPMTAVVASITTIIIANKTTDALVVDDYYKAGLAINQTLDRIALAKKYNIAASVHYANTLLTITLTTDNAETLTTSDTLILRLIHPTLRNKDVSVKLKYAGKGKYIGQLPQQEKTSLMTNWYVQLEPATNNKTSNLKNSWRINGKIKMASMSQLNNYKLTSN